MTMGKIIYTTKIVFHAWAMNGELQFSFLGAGDYFDIDKAYKEGKETCKEFNAEESYRKWTFEVVRLSGECSEW